MADLSIPGVDPVYMKLLTGRRLIIVALVAVLPMMAGYFSAYGRLSSTEIVSAAVPLEPAVVKPLGEDIKSKGHAPLSPKEYVMIGGKRFEVRPPWLGHRIKGESDPQNLNFAMLPVELVLEKRQIYVTIATRDAFVVMAAAAALEGIKLLVDSGYRSAAYQRQIYQRKMGQGDDFYDIARGVAPPGYSEHMLGTTLDLVPSKWTFSGTLADKWLRENGGEFAFIQSYPQKSDLGFTWEPWHWKYVGDS
ncbi:MAG: M15 family metallopeptidase [Desulfobulbaceae bacterium]|nr:M15 family metallopeptidase [Desulfobulbaceae bacterium]